MKQLLPLLILLFFSSCSHESPPIEKKSRVRVIKAKKKNHPIYLQSKGYIQPKATVHLSSRVTGEITGVYFQEGQDVKRGDLLFTIDPRNFQSNLKRKKGVLEEKITQLKLAQEKVERYRGLTQDQYYSKMDFDALVSNVNTLLASIKQTEAELEDASTHLSYCWIYSPIDGKTGTLQIDEGNIVQGWENETLVTIHQTKPIYAIFTLPENKLSLIAGKKKLPVEISTDSFLQDQHKGTLEMIDNQINNENITLKALFPNDEENLWPNQSVAVRLYLGMLEDVICIPEEALIHRPDGIFLYLVGEGNLIYEKKVVIGESIEGKVVIKEGLQEGEEVVVEKEGRLQVGSKVWISL